MNISQRIIFLACLVLGVQHFGSAIEVSEFYEFDKTIRLENGENKFEIIKLATPINFFSDTFDHIYVSIMYSNRQRTLSSIVERTKRLCLAEHFVDNGAVM